MKNNNPTANCPAVRGAKRYFRERESHRQGSAIILVIVSIVLVAILGATMVQVARFERLTASEENIDVVVASVLDLIAVRLSEDIVDDNGNIFNPGDPASGGADEPYDFPFTRQDTSGQFFAERIDGTSVLVFGGAYDDMWLANVEPYNNGGTQTWRHITNLTGIRLSSNGSADLSQNIEPLEELINGEDSNVAVTNNQLVDADGDGIGDSRWAWAPLKQVGGTRYVMAVRIIDLSARLDANVATSIHDTTNPGAGVPRGDNPSELDGTGFTTGYANANGVAPGTWGGEWLNAMYGRRFGIASVANLPSYGDRDTAATREHYWYRGASRAGLSFANNGDSGGGYDYTGGYGVDDMFELLQNGGLATSATTTIESDHPGMLRDGANETTYTDFAGTVADYFSLNPRLAISAFTGHGIYAKPARANDSLFTNLGRQVDINRASPGDLSLAILDVLGSGTTPVTLDHLNAANLVSDQLAANLKDYSDEDNWVTRVNGQYGFEALPMITEVYTERVYTPNNGPDVAGNTTVTWDGSAAETAWAVEITNPYHRPILLTDVQLRIAGSPVTGGGGTDLASLVGETWLDPGQMVVVYHDAGTSDFAGTKIDGSPPSVNVGNLFPNAENVSVTLHAKEDPTDDSYTNIASITAPVAYIVTPYQQADVVAMPESYDETVLTADAPGPDPGLRQASSQGDGDGLNALHITPAEFLTNGDSTLVTPSSPPADIDALGSNNKPGNVKGFKLIEQQIVHQDRPMKYVGDLLQVPIFGFDAGATMAEQLEAFGIATTTDPAPQFEQMMLPYDNAAPKIDGSFIALNYPHSVVLMDRLTVDSPYGNGEDNNGDGTIDDEGEFVIAGRVNLNTAPQRLLERILPYPDQATRVAVAQAIVDHRNNPSADGVGVAGTPGIAYVGALYDRINNVTNVTGRTANGGGHVDWNDWEEPTTGFTGTLSNQYNVDGKSYEGEIIVDDREEQIMLAKWLNEVGSTRSDVFAAYIIVQGYPAADFTAGPNESAKLMAIFSRANVRGAGDKAQILAVLRLE